MSRARMNGLTLVELMVAMVLGLVVIGGAVSLTLANRQSFRTNEGLSQVQESARTAFELIARDIRQAGVTGCDNEGRIANVIDTTAGAEWWMGWFGLRGFEDDDDSSWADFGTARSERVDGTDALQLQGIQGVALSLESHNDVTATMEINAAATDIAVGDIMVACDFDHAAIFEVTAYDSGAVTVTHADTGTPGNCSSGLGFPTDCSSATGNVYRFERNTQLAHFFATDWYIGQTDREEDGGSALFRRRIGAGGDALTEEVVAGVTDMQLSYRVDESDEFLDAEDLAAADWADVNAVRIELAVASADARVSTELDNNDGRIGRRFAQVVTLRNRVP